MRVVQAMAGAATGGAEAFFMRLVPALSEVGVEQAAIIRSHTQRAEELALAGIATRQLRFGGPLDLVSRVGYAQAIRQADPDIVMTWMSRASGRCPAGRHVQIGRLGGFYDLKYYRRCKHLVGNTQGIVDYIVGQGWPADRAHMISNFVDTGFAVPIPREDLDTPADVPLLLAMGRLHPNKAFEVLIDALVDVPEAWLWLAGNGPLDKLLRSHARDCGVLDRIRFLGWRDDIGSLLASADILVCPSRHEPLGNVILEGWARSVPVVAAASQGPSELIVDGETGLLARVDDAIELAEKINQALGDQTAASAMTERALADYEARFSKQAIVGQFRALFEQVTG
jgi:glycosyltransferase involved in cell wall biosynthesis